MSRFLALTSALLVLVLAGCDSSADDIQLAEPSAESFSLVYTPDEGGTVGPISGSTRYETIGSPATSGAFVPLASATLRPTLNGMPAGTLVVYSTLGTADFPPPGRYALSADDRQIVVLLTVGGLQYSPYRGAVTIEFAGPTALRVRIDADMTSGSCSGNPTCDDPRQTGRLQAIVRAGADG